MDKYQKYITELDNAIATLEKLAQGEYKKEILTDLNTAYQSGVQTADRLYAIPDLSDEQVANIDEKLDSVEVLYDKILFFALGSAFEKIEEDEKRQKSIERRIEAQQGLQFTIFSIVIAVISFILNNAKILSIEGLSLKTILLVNISYILAVSVLFAFIYIFMGFNYDNKRWKYWFLSMFPVLMILSLILVGVFL